MTLIQIDKCDECSADSTHIFVNRNTGQVLCTECGADLTPRDGVLASVMERDAHEAVVEALQAFVEEED